MRKKQNETTDPIGVAAAPAAAMRVKEKVPAKPRATKKSFANGVPNGTANGLSHLAEAVSPSTTEDRDAVALRAYFRWLERGCPAGSAEQDWLEAEREVQAV